MDAGMDDLIRSDGDGNLHFFDSSGRRWRAFELVSNTIGDLWQFESSGEVRRYFIRTGDRRELSIENLRRMVVDAERIDVNS